MNSEQLRQAAKLHEELDVLVDCLRCLEDDYTPEIVINGRNSITRRLDLERDDVYEIIRAMAVGKVDELVALGVYPARPPFDPPWKVSALRAYDLEAPAPVGEFSRDNPEPPAPGNVTFLNPHELEAARGTFASPEEGVDADDADVQF